MNFLQETKKAILDSGHKLEEVMFIGSSNGEYRMSWDKFVTKANFEYDNGFGSSKIAVDLIIYFNDKTYIQRGEYDEEVDEFVKNALNWYKEHAEELIEE